MLKRGVKIFSIVLFGPMVTFDQVYLFQGNGKKPECGEHLVVKNQC
jgi:hypothetical protein